MLSATSNNNSNTFNDPLFHYANINNNNNNINNNSLTSSEWFDPLDTISNNIFTPHSTSSTSSTSLESPLTFQNININNNNITDTNSNTTNYVNNPISKHASFKTLKFDKITPTRQQQIKKEPFEDTNIVIKKKRNASNRKRLTQHQKEAHNRIEKRYRININTKIAKLQQIIPWVSANDTAFQVSDTLSRENTSTPNDATNNNNNNNNNNTKLNKSMVLEKALDYILFLQNNQHLYELELQRLRNELDSLKKGNVLDH